ncbi:MAG TPA: hypothetical protein VFZ10_13350 [Geminicoccaceae bacterium]
MATFEAIAFAKARSTAPRPFAGILHWIKSGHDLGMTIFEAIAHATARSGVQ